MKEDKLKKFIADHRDEFDQERPSSQVWSQIEKQLHSNVSDTPKIKTLILKMMKIAAGVCILLLAGAGGGAYVQQAKYGEASAITNKQNRAEYLEAKTYFTNQIDSKLLELQKYQSGDDVIHELNQIDQISSELKMEILKNPDQDKDLLIKQMIMQYQQKLSTLNKILDKLENSNQSNTNQSTKLTKPNDTLQL